MLTQLRPNKWHCRLGGRLLAKTVVAIGVGLLGGFGTLALASVPGFDRPLREGIGNGGCAGSKIRAPEDVA